MGARMDASGERFISATGNGSDPRPRGGSGFVQCAESGWGPTPLKLVDPTWPLAHIKSAIEM